VESNRIDTLQNDLALSQLYADLFRQERREKKLWRTAAILFACIAVAALIVLIWR